MYKFSPILKTRVWGTESWALSAVPGSESVVCEGPDKGKKITELRVGVFPLLVKFIDARSDLSIQVHPDDALARERHGCNGKTEMWYIIGADKGAKLISGLKAPLDRDSYGKMVADGSIVDVLASHEVHPEDVFFLPAGRVHAIGGGCFLAEIQQTSDITYRIFDYNRPGLDGKPRQLHTDLAKDAIDYRVLPDYRTHYKPRKDAETLLVDCPYFRTCRLDLTAPLRKELSDCGEFLVLVCLGGSGTVRTQNESYTLKAGETLLAPASDEALELLPDDGGMNLLTCFVPEQGTAGSRTTAADGAFASVCSGAVHGDASAANDGVGNAPDPAAAPKNFAAGQGRGKRK